MPRKASTLFDSMVDERLRRKFTRFPRINPSLIHRTRGSDESRQADPVEMICGWLAARMRTLINKENIQATMPMSSQSLDACVSALRVLSTSSNYQSEDDERKGKGRKSSEFLPAFFSSSRYLLLSPFVAFCQSARVQLFSYLLSISWFIRERKSIVSQYRTWTSFLLHWFLMKIVSRRTDTWWSVRVSLIEAFALEIFSLAERKSRTFVCVSCAQAKAMNYDQIT